MCELAMEQEPRVGDLEYMANLLLGTMAVFVFVVGFVWFLVLGIKQRSLLMLSKYFILISKGSMLQETPPTPSGGIGGPC